jgi:hypothetical protein
VARMEGPVASTVIVASGHSIKGCAGCIAGHHSTPALRQISTRGHAGLGLLDESHDLFFGKQALPPVHDSSGERTACPLAWYGVTEAGQTARHASLERRVADSLRDRFAVDAR